jgi:hypothetical protein
MTKTGWDAFPIVAIQDGQGLTIQERFEDFHAKNPWVYQALRHLMAEAVRKNVKKIGIKLLYERLRWDVITTTTATDFKLNDHFTSRYARLLDAEFPGILELRKLRSR